MIRIAIVEDDTVCAGQLESCARRYGKEKKQQVRTAIFRSGLDFISDYTADYDIVLMDIEMPHMDGLETARKLRELDREICLIFVTNMAQYAINGYEVQALDFMVKPVGYFNLSLKLDRAVSICKRRAQVHLFVPVEQGMQKLDVADIFYIESDKHYLNIYTEGQSYRLRGTIGALMEKLPENSFACCSKSYCVNMEHVSRFGAGEVTVGGRTLSISRAYRREFIDRLTTFFNRGGN